ncbi:MAG: DUF1801 domain-containing protein [Pseudomonadota bacterium]
MTPLFANPAVADAFAAFPGEAREGLLRLRGLIFEIADEEQVGPLTETLKWGQPAYLTEASKAGTTIRLGLPKTGGWGLYVHCQTSIIGEARDALGDQMTFDGNRGVLLTGGEAETLLRPLIRRALTYRQR